MQNQEVPVERLKIYVASSWRNRYFDWVVQKLIDAGHDVYDFKKANGFSWSSVDPDWKKWPDNVGKYIRGLAHPLAIAGFESDANALKECDVCVQVQPCGASASWEAGYAAGAGKWVYVCCPEIREPELMVKLAGKITDDLEEILDDLEIFKDVILSRRTK